MWSVGECLTGYFAKHQQCGEPSHKLRTAILLRGRQLGTCRGADILNHLASANPVSLCIPMAFGEVRQPTREGHE
uniref:Uncharacterized protein n=1 Tax=Mesocestoides corti TaxID=53468 RepID=A0A5K3EXH2_MESCO